MQRGALPEAAWQRPKLKLKSTKTANSSADLVSDAQDGRAWVHSMSRTQHSSPPGSAC